MSRFGKAVAEMWARVPEAVAAGNAAYTKTRRTLEADPTVKQAIAATQTATEADREGGVTEGVRRMVEQAPQGAPLIGPTPRLDEALGILEEAAHGTRLGKAVAFLREVKDAAQK